MTILNKTIILCCMVVLSFFCFQKVANASVIEENIFESERYFAPASNGVCNLDGEGCVSYFGSPEDPDCTAYWMQWILNIIKYVAIAALLILSTVDFIKALVSNDKDALKKAGVTTAKRFIFCVLLFFLPIIVDFIMSLIGAYGTCGIE